MATTSIATKLDSHSTVISYPLKTWFDDPEGQFDDFSVKIPKLEREKIGLFYDYAADGDYLKNIHFDAYTQTIERKFEKPGQNDPDYPQPDD
ncbi:Uncharacterised protein [Citrobacter braakii]|nr:Uncharacterised protein [Citrobacter braakii]